MGDVGHGDVDVDAGGTRGESSSNTQRAQNTKHSTEPKTQDNDLTTRQDKTRQGEGCRGRCDIRAIYVHDDNDGDDEQQCSCSVYGTLSTRAEIRDTRDENGMPRIHSPFFGHRHRDQEIIQRYGICKTDNSVGVGVGVRIASEVEAEARRQVNARDRHKGRRASERATATRKAAKKQWSSGTWRYVYATANMCSMREMRRCMYVYVYVCSRGGRRRPRRM